MRTLIFTAILATIIPGLASADCPELNPTDISNCGPTYTLPQWSNTGGWDQPQYYQTIQTADVDGDGRNELIARGALGLHVYSFDVGSGQWIIPLGDTIALRELSDLNGWDQPQYYQTIQLADLDGDGKAELLARGKDGVVVFAWETATNSFTQLGTTGILTDAQGWDKPQYYKTIQAADVDGDGRQELLARGANGLLTFAWNASASQFSQIGQVFPTLSDFNGWAQPQYYETIQTGHVTDQTKAQIIARGAAGLKLYSWNGNDYIPLVTDGPFKDQDGNNQPQYYRTIQVADFDGDGFDEVFGREASYNGSLVAYAGGSSWTPISVSSNGFSAWNSVNTYETIHAADVDGDGSAEVIGIAPQGTFSPAGVYVAKLNDANNEFEFVSYGSPELESASIWDAAGLYSTLQSAEINGEPGEELLARGIYGMRTWVPVADGYARPIPYGYPAFTGAESTAYDALNEFLGFTSQTVRDLYAGSNSPDASTISSTMVSIASLCQDVLAANPEQFKTCATPPASQNVDGAAYTAVSNQILAELFWAGETLSYFTSQSDILGELFQNQSATLPSITADLKLDQAKNTKARADYSALFASTVSVGLFAVSKLGPELDIAAGITGQAIGFIGALNDAARGTQPNVDPIDKTYDEILDEVAMQQEQQEDALEAQRIWVMSDLSLLTAVGSQVNSGAFAVNRNATLSAGRQAFSLWAYQLYLPKLWSYYVVTSCKNHTTEGFGYTNKYVCSPPTSGIYYDGPVGSDFNAILDRQTKCTSKSSVAGFWVTTTYTCDFTTPSSTELDTLTTPLTPMCTYDGNAVVWEYGCTLGVPMDDLFQNQNGWQLETRLCHPGKCSTQSALSAGPALEAKVKRVGRKNSHLSLEGTFPLEREVDLRDIVSVVVWRVLFDFEENVELLVEHEALPLVLEPVNRSSRLARLRGSTDAGARVDLAIRSKAGELQVKIDVRRANLNLETLCERFAEPELGIEFDILDNRGESMTFSTVNHFQCSEDG